MAGCRVLRGFVRGCPKLQAGLRVVRYKIHTKAAATVEELENVYAERKCSIYGTSVTLDDLLCLYCFVLIQLSRDNK